MAPAAFRRHWERGGESPPSSSSSLTFPLDGRRVSPLVLGFHGGEGAGAPPRLDLSLSLSLCFLLFLRSLILPFHRFLNSRRFVTPIGLKFGHDFYPDIGFLASKEGHQLPYGVATRVGALPPSLWALGHRLALILVPKNHIYSKIILHKFLSRLDFVWWIFCEIKNMQKTETGTRH